MKFNFGKFNKLRLNNMKFNFKNRYKMIYNKIKDSELENFLNDKDLVILDVRSKDEFLKMRIKKSININVIDLDRLINSFVPDKNSKIFIYCLNGSRTRIAINKLNRLGYYNLYVFNNGGINEIRNESLIEY